MSEKAKAIEDILALIKRHDISVDEISGAIEGQAGEEENSLTGSGRIFAYIGGVFILCGLGFFIESFWDSINAAARIILYLGSGEVMFIVAQVLASQSHYLRTSMPLFILAAVFQSGGMMVAFDELGTGGDVRNAIIAVSLVMLLQNLLVFYVYRLGVLLTIAVVFGLALVVDVLEIIGIDGEWNAAIAGSLVLGFSYVINSTSWRQLTPGWFFIGGAMAGGGFFGVLEDTSFHLLYIGLSAGLFYLSILVRSRTLLFVATCTMIGYLSYFTSEYFADSIGWPISLIIIGIILIGFSMLALNINRKYLQARQ